MESQIQRNGHAEPEKRQRERARASSNIEKRVSEKMSRKEKFE
jgi:hypothetical protein